MTFRATVTEKVLFLKAVTVRSINQDEIAQYGGEGDIYRPRWRAARPCTQQISRLAATASGSPINEVRCRINEASITASSDTLAAMSCPMANRGSLWLCLTPRVRPAAKGIIFSGGLRWHSRHVTPETQFESKWTRTCGAHSEPDFQPPLS